MSGKTTYTCASGGCQSVTVETGDGRIGVFGADEYLDLLLRRLNGEIVADEWNAHFTRKESTDGTASPSEEV